MNIINIKEKIFMARHATGGNWEMYRSPYNAAPPPEVVAEQYAKDFGLHTDEAVEIKDYGFYRIQEIVSYKATAVGMRA